MVGSDSGVTTNTLHVHHVETRGFQISPVALFRHIDTLTRQIPQFMLHFLPSAPSPHSDSCRDMTVPRLFQGQCPCSVTFRSCLYLIPPSRFYHDATVPKESPHLTAATR